MPLAFSLHLAVLDILLRGPRFYLLHPRAVGHLVASIALLRLVASLRNRGVRVASALLLGVAVTLQAAFFRYYHTALDEQAAIAARFAWGDVRPVVVHALPAFFAVALLVAAMEYAFLLRATPVRSRHRLTAIALVLGVMVGGPFRYGTTEIRTAQAATGFALAKRPAGDGVHRSLPPLVSSRRRVPSILFLVTESVRAQDFCGDARPCTASPALDAELPDRIPLLEMRSTSSYTAISMSVLWTGLPQVGPRGPIASAPDLFDLVRATRADGTPVGMHYWTSHTPNFFERKDPQAAVDSYTTADVMVGHAVEDVEDSVEAGLDRRLATECQARFGTLKPPFVAMVHFSGTHAPYFFNDAEAPHRPFARVVTWSGLDDLHRSYQNAIAEQDRSLAACVRAFRAAQGDAPHVILFTSDHGEAFGEHSAIHHGQSLYDEQIHVPMFVAAFGGALNAEEESALKSARNEFVTHLDVLPTVLDALGIWDHFAIARDRAKMPGRSLLRPRPAPVAVPVTNCTEMWKCPLDTWGLLAGDRKLIAQAWDADWRCWSLRGGEVALPAGACDDLLRASRGVFSARPNGVKNP